MSRKIMIPAGNRFPGMQEYAWPAPPGHGGADELAARAAAQHVVEGEPPLDRVG